MIRAELSIAVFAALNVAAAFLNQLLIFGIVGPGAQTDALFASATIPTVISSVFAVVVPAVLVPRWAGEQHQSQVDEAVPAVLGLGLVTILIAGAFILPAHWWTGILFRGFSSDVAALCARLLRVQMTAAVLTVLWTVLAAVLWARGRFLMVEALTFATSVAALIALSALLPSYGVEAAAWLNLARNGLMLCFCLPLLGCWPSGSVNWSAMTGRLKQMSGLMFANAYYKTEVLVDRHLLSMAPTGNLSLYGLAQLLHSSGSAVIGKVWGTNAVTRLAEYARTGDYQRFAAFYWRNLAILLALSIAACCALGIVGLPILESAPNFGRMSIGDVHQLWWMLLLLSGILVGGSCGSLLAGAFYAVGDTSTPTNLSVATFTFSVLVKYAAFSAYGVAGLCIVSSMYYLVNAALLLLLFMRRVRRIAAA